jgi:hypothetical protein
MQVSEKAARKMLTAAGFTATDVCPIEGLQEKINDLLLVEEQLEQPQDKEDRILLRKCLKANQNGEVIAVGDSAPSNGQAKEEQPLPALSEEPKNKKEKRSKSPKIAKPLKASKPAKANKPAKGMDSFGCGLSSSAAKLNACLSSTPKGIKELVSEAGLGNDYNWPHLDYLVEHGLVKSEGGKYALAK